MQKVLGSHPASAPVLKLLPEDTVTGVYLGTDAFLNADFTVSHVRAGLRKLSAGTAAGIDGMSAELLKHGPFHMQHCLAKLFTSSAQGDLSHIAHHWPSYCSIQGKEEGSSQHE